MTVDRRALAVVGCRRAPVAAVFAGGGVAAVALGVAARHAGGVDELLPTARLSAIVVAATCAGAAVDPTSPLTDSMWRGRRWRAPVVFAPTLLIAVAAWTSGVAVARRLSEPGPLPTGGLLIELVVLIIVCWAATATVARYSGERYAGLVGGTGVVGVAGATMLMPRTRVWFWTNPGDGWTASHLLWVAVGALATATLAAVWRDPVR